MKKIVNIILIFLVLFVSIFTIKTYAVSLDNFSVLTTKQTVHPGENVTVNVSFGQDMGAYTVTVTYDSNILEYVSAEGGTSNNTGSSVITTFYDQTGGSSPRNSMSVTFKAKDVNSTNPSNFGITATGLANADASVTYDDITTPITKEVVVEPDYKDYKIELKYTGDVIKNEEKDMKIAVSSTMGRNYEHTRIIAELTAPTGGTAKLLATDTQRAEHDIIQSGWGSAEGDPIGGKDVVKELATRGLFDTVGKYTITLKLIDRDNSDAVIASGTFNIDVKDKTTGGNNSNNNNNNQKPENNNSNIGNIADKEEEPTVLPQTGNTIYLAIISIIGTLVISYFALKKKD